MNNKDDFFGACRFCGQIAAGTVEGAKTQEEADIKATMSCECSDARELQKKEKQKKNAKANIKNCQKNFLNRIKMP